MLSPAADEGKAEGNLAEALPHARRKAGHTGAGGDGAPAGLPSPWVFAGPHTHTHTGAGDTLLHAPHPHALDCDERVCELGHNPGQEHFSLRCTVRRRLKN